MVPAQNVKELIESEQNAVPLVKEVSQDLNQVTPINSLANFSRDELITYAQQLTEQNRKQEDFMNTICHEIRNPLHGIYNSLDLFEKKILNMTRLIHERLGGNLKEEVEGITGCMSDSKEMLESLKQCAKQQKKIVDDVLSFSKIVNNKMELNNLPFNPKQVIQTVKQMFNLQLQSKQLGWIVELSEENLWVKGDAQRLTQIITNLVSNALKFTEEGHIKLKMEIQPLSDGRIDLRFAVADTGMGMTAEETTRIFKKFGQANEKISAEFGGSGLGLPICKGLAQLMGGDIQVESEKGRGTVFSFNIQCSSLTEQEKLQVQDSSKRKLTPTKSNLPPLKLLVVDDNIINRRVAVQQLDKEHTITLATNGKEAIEKWQEAIKQGEKFDFILMDVHMPIMGGIEATKKIREEEKKLGLSPVFIIGTTGSSFNDKNGKHLREAGMNNWLSKPYSKKKLADAMIALLEPQSVSQECSEQAKVETLSSNNNSAMNEHKKRKKELTSPNNDSASRNSANSVFESPLILFNSNSSTKRKLDAEQKENMSLGDTLATFNVGSMAQ